MELPNNIRKRIIDEATEYAHEKIENNDYVDNALCSYADGATSEALRAQKLVEALEAVLPYLKAPGTNGNHWVPQVETALAEWKGVGKEVELTCMVCGEKFMGPEPKMCCSGRDCGCMGLPVEPIVCSKECYEKGIPPQKGDSGGTVEAIDRPCPHCGKELSRDRNLCCRECGKEVTNG